MQTRLHELRPQHPMICDLLPLGPCPPGFAPAHPHRLSGRNNLAGITRSAIMSPAGTRRPRTKIRLGVSARAMAHTFGKEARLINNGATT
jgi:hypothetical protein